MTTFKRQRGFTEQAADAAVDQTCRRLRLPTIGSLTTLRNPYGTGSPVPVGVGADWGDR